MLRRKGVPKWELGNKVQNPGELRNQLDGLFFRWLKYSKKARRYAAWLTLILVLSGCGGPTHYPVTGKVTFDGDPLPDAILSFMPASDEQPPLFTRTDAEGNYVLDGSDGVPGALVGEYTVRITTFREGNPDIDPPIPSAPEKVPAEYNVQSKLTVAVKPEENVFDLAIASEKRHPLAQRSP